MKVYVLIENDYDGGNRLAGVITRSDVAVEWGTHRHQWFEEFELDDTKEFQWIVNRVDKQRERP